MTGLMFERHGESRENAKKTLQMTRAGDWQVLQREEKQGPFVPEMQTTKHPDGCQLVVGWAEGNRVLRDKGC